MVDVKNVIQNVKLVTDLNLQTVKIVKDHIFYIIINVYQNALKIISY